jgi:hypothetical protein
MAVEPAAIAPTYGGISRSSIFPPLVLDDRVPLGEIWLTRGDGRIEKLGNWNRECGQGKVGGCELGLGHPGPCLGFGPRGEYLVWEPVTGRLLREI